MIGCSVGSSDPVLVSLTPQNDIVVVDGQSVQFTVVTIEDPSSTTVVWEKSSPDGRPTTLNGIKGTTVSIPFTLAENGYAVVATATAGDGRTESLATKPVKVIPR
jgi:hypothetical protein